MSCHCNKCIQVCNPCVSTCQQQQCNPCDQFNPIIQPNIAIPIQGNILGPQISGYAPPMWNQCETEHKCGCEGCHKKHKHHRKESDCDCEDSDNHKHYKKESESDCKDSGKRTCNRKQCNKCFRYNCDCTEVFPCLRTKCGTISAVLTKAVAPYFFTTIGQVITYSYTVTNTGTAAIYGTIQICDSRLGTQIIPCTYIPPCLSQTFTRTYTTVASDLMTPYITNTAIAYIQVKKNKSVSTQPAFATITFGDADVFGSINQVLAPGTGGTGGNGTVDVFIGNMGIPTSQSAAFGIQLLLPFPAGVTSTQITGLAGFGSAATPVVTTTGVLISEGTIALASTNHYQFVYGPLTTGNYTWSGTITTQSFDPNINNNTLVSNTIVVS